ncbi:ABC transporter ATP-binding protein [Bacillus litorisediminis]|uniref:ABC transporter ATP-binding protein n=1 Tax=Bacillus litorisediminis TaxID=2922713 RepID=UPI001FAE9E78|nr:ABC transporter ATP-binding protein [Bacillus litorisediminis]
MSNNLNFTGKYSMKEVLKSIGYWPLIIKILWVTNKKLFLLLLLLNLLIGLGPVLNIYATQQLINKLSSSNSIVHILPYVLLFCSILLTINFSQAFKNMINNLFNNEVLNKINIEIIEKANSLTLEDFENPDIQDQVKRAQQESGRVPIQTFHLMISIVTSIITFFSVASLIYYNLKWLVVLFLVLPILYLIPNMKLAQYEYEIYWNRAPKQRISWYLTYLITNYRSFKEIKINNSGPHIIKEYSAIVHDFIDEDYNIQKKRLIIFIVVDLLTIIVVGYALIKVVTISVQDQLMIGSTVALIQSIIVGINKVSEISTSIISICQNNFSLDQYFKFTTFSSNKNSIKILENELYLPLEDIYSIEFRDVFFRYPNTETYSLKGISFKVRKGETVAVVGENGSGKSTIAKLIARLYIQDSGEILINNVPIERYNTEDLRKNISVMHQDYECYEFSLRKNISITDLNRKSDDYSLKNSIENANLLKVLEKLNNNIDTQLGKWFKEGVQLSGGEWQKVAYARTIFKNASLNILDEPTSALDPIAEEQLLINFKKYSKDKIAIFISHRYSNIKHADRIIVVDNGIILEDGTHDELYNKNGHYFQLYNKQTGIFSAF